MAMGREALGGALVGSSEDDEEKECGQDDLGDEAGQQRVAFGRMCAVAVGGEASGEREAFFAAGRSGTATPDPAMAPST